MIAKVRKGLVVSATLVTLAAIVALVPRARGQYPFDCCQGLVQYPIYCTDGQGCVLNGYINRCDFVSYGGGDWYWRVTEYCCNQQAPYPNWQDQDGYCYIGGNAPAQLSERVWVRDCHGRYALITVPIHVYAS